MILSEHFLLKLIFAKFSISHTKTADLHLCGSAAKKELEKWSSRENRWDLAENRAGSSSSSSFAYGRSQTGWKKSEVTKEKEEHYRAVLSRSCALENANVGSNVIF